MGLAFLLYFNIFLILLVLIYLLVGKITIVTYIILGACIVLGIIFTLYVLYLVLKLIIENKRFIPYVPTPMNAVREMIKMADIQEGNSIYDLGCGDGRLVIEASKIKNTKCIGVENAIDIYFLAKLRNWFFKGNAIIKRGDMYKEDIKDADIIFVYLLPHAMDKIEDIVKNACKKNLIIVSHGFKFKNLKCLEERNVGKLIIRRYSLI